MRNAIWMFVILALGVAYTIYGIVTFTPEQPVPIQFEEVEDIITRNREAAKLSGQTEALTLNNAELVKKNQILTRIKQTVNSYETAIPSAHKRIAPLMHIFAEYTRTTSLPAVFVNPEVPQGYYMLQFPTAPLRDVQEEGTMSLSCSGGGASSASTSAPIAVTMANILVGDDRPNKLSCTATTNPQSPLIMVGGPGNDTLTSGNSTVILSPGSGDDSMTVSGGQAFIYLDDGWGKDTLEIDCSTASIDKNTLPEALPVPWNFPYKHFLIFSPRTSPSDIKWEDGSPLKNIRTGDTLDIKGSCINLIFSAPPNTSPAPISPDSVQ